MASVHVFVSTGRFSSFGEMRQYVDVIYTEDGDAISSPFMKEVGLEAYEPGCIEAVVSPSGAAVPIATLLSRSSWAEQWLEYLPAELSADAALCVFEPNRLARPEGCSLTYLGKFEFVAKPSEWFRNTFAGK
jgi:immunity protein 22 of polymorphic toxin system